MRIQTYKIKIIDGLYAQFVYGTFEQLHSCVLRLGITADIEHLNDAMGASIGHVIWVSSSQELGSVGFIKTLVHECSHFAEAANEQHDLEQKSYVVSILVDKILSKYMSHEPAGHDSSNTVSTGTKIQPLKVSLAVFGYEVFFLHCSYEDLEIFVHNHKQGVDISELEGAASCGIGNLMWVSDSIPIDTTDFIVHAAHDVMLITGIATENLGLEGTEVRAYTAEYIIGEILEHTIKPVLTDKPIALTGV